MADPEKVIQITESELKQMMSDVAKQTLEGAGIQEGGNSRVLRRVTERRVEVRLVDGKVVVGFKNRGSEERPVYIYEVPDPKDPKQNVSMVDLLLEGSDEPLTVNFSEFRREGERAQCKVVKTEEKEWVLNQGVVKKREVEEYAMLELDYDVPLDIVGKARFFYVEVPKEFGGPRTVQIHENYVNIA